jgi:hypothetical protein
MSPNQSKAVVLAIAGTIDIEAVKYDPQEIIGAVHDGRIGRLINEMLAKRSWKLLCPPPLAIDRSIKVNQLGPMWEPWLGPVDGDGLLVDGEPDQDPRSVLVTTFDVSKAVIMTCMVGKETTVTGEERRLRIRKGPITPIDFHIGWSLVTKGQEHLRWLYDNYGVQWIETDTVLRSPFGNRCSLVLYRQDDGSWDWDFSWLDDDRYASCPALGIASPQDSVA